MGVDRAWRADDPLWAVQVSGRSSRVEERRDPPAAEEACFQASWLPPWLACRSMRSVGVSGLPESAFRLGGLGGENIHQGRAEAVVRLQTFVAQRLAHVGHGRRRRAVLDDRGDEGRKAGAVPAGILRQLRVDEVETVERVILLLDAAIQVRT